jgi:flavoprotein
VQIERQRIAAQWNFSADKAALCTRCGRVVPALPISAISIEAGFAPETLARWLGEGKVHRVAPAASLVCAESLLRAVREASESEA